MKGASYMTINPTVVIALLIIATLTIIGLVRGLFKSVFSLFETILIFVLALLAKSYVTDFLKDTEFIYSFVYDHVASWLDLPIADRTDAVAVIQNMTLPDAVKDLIINALDSFLESAELTINSFTSAIYIKITDVILGIVGFILAFIAAFVLVHLLSKALDLLTKLPFLKQINHIGGLILGFFEGVIAVWVLCGVISAFSTLGWFGGVVNDIHESKFLTYMYDHSLVGATISGNISDTLSGIADIDDITTQLKDMGLEEITK